MATKTQNRRARIAGMSVTSVRRLRVHVYFLMDIDGGAERGRMAFPEREGCPPVPGQVTYKDYVCTPVRAF